MSVTETLAFLALLARPGDVYELRGLAKGRSVPQVTAGFFDDMAKLAAAAQQRSGRDDGVYITLNPVNPALLSRKPKNAVHQVGNGDTTSDRDVEHRRHLLVDVDPVRPTGISSTEAEHDAAIALARRIRDELTARGWPAPILADSGNGGHLVYAIDLPRDDGELVKRVLARLSKLYTTDEQKVDEKVFNPSRISKLYGTLTKKGENTEDRPHRLSRVLEHPDAMTAVTREQLEALAPIATPDRARTTSPSSYEPRDGRPRFEIDAWLAQHLPDAIEQPWSSGRKWLLPVCPFNDSHNRKEAFVVEKHGGQLGAGCLHESCKWEWRELRAHFEPDRRDRASHLQQPMFTDREPPPEVLFEDREYAAAIEAEIDTFAARDRDPIVRQAVEPAEEPIGLISIESAYDELELLRSAPVFETPFPTLNDSIGFGGLLGTQVYTVAAGTGRGKTTWVAAVAAHVASKGIPVLVASWEMRPGYFVARRAGGRLGMHSNDVLRPQTDDPEQIAVLRERVLGVMPRERFHFIHKPSLKRLRRAVEHVVQLYGQPPLLVVDYLQKLADHISRTMARPDQRAATTEASESLCEIAETSRAAVIAVSAIGRGNNKRASSPRKLAPYELVDVAKESGSVEYDGAGLIVLSLDNEVIGSERVATMTIAKSRFGEEIHIDARYNGRRGEWRDVGPLDVPLALPNSGGTGTPDERIRRAIARALLELGAVTSKDAIAKAAKMRSKEIRDVLDQMVAAGEIDTSRKQYALTDSGRAIALEGQLTMGDR